MYDNVVLLKVLTYIQFCMRDLKRKNDKIFFSPPPTKFEPGLSIVGNLFVHILIMYLQSEYLPTYIFFF